MRWILLALVLLATPARADEPRLGLQLNGAEIADQIHHRGWSDDLCVRAAERYARSRHLDARVRPLLGVALSTAAAATGLLVTDGILWSQAPDPQPYVPLFIAGGVGAGVASGFNAGAGWTGWSARRQHKGAHKDEGRCVEARP